MKGKMWLLAGSALLLCAGGTAVGEEIRDGSLVLSETNGLIFFEAKNAPLESVLGAAGRACGVAFQSNKLPERRVTARYLGVTLEDFLERLDLSFGLVMSARGDEALLQFTDSVPATNALGAWARMIAAPVRPKDLPGPETWSDEIQGLIKDLHDDDIRGNGTEAIWRLQELGTGAVEALEYTLYDDDYQARQFAAVALRSSVETNGPASDRFLQVLVEGMADDEFPSDSQSTNFVYTDVYNARMAYDYFGDHSEDVQRVEPLLVHGLFSDDGQMRLLSAFLLAENNKTEYAARLAAILIPHLRDNQLASDAGLAAYGLNSLGESVRPYLVAAAGRSNDQQQKVLLNYLLAVLNNPDAEASPDVLDILTYSSLDERPPIAFWDWTPENFPEPDTWY